MNIAQHIINNINKSTLVEKASIDWNNYLTPEEVEKFLSKDDKVESAEDIIYSDDFKKRFQDLHNDLQKKYNNSWTKLELVHDLEQFYNNGHLNESVLNEGIHLVAFCKDEDGNQKRYEDNDYSSKQDYIRDLKANGCTNISVLDNRDLYLLDNTDYTRVSQLKNEIQKVKQDIAYNKENGYEALLKSSEEQLAKLLDLLNKVNEVQLTESNLNEDDKSLWKSQIDTKSKEELNKYLSKLYKQLRDYNSNEIKSNKYYDILDKIEYIESKTGSKPNIGRILR